MAAYTLEQLAKLTDSKLIGDPNHKIYNVEDLESAGPGDAAFLENPRYEKQMRCSKAGVICISPNVSQEPSQNYLISTTPSLTFQKLIEIFLEDPKSGFDGIHPTSVIHPDAILGKNVSVGPYAVVDRGARIGDNTIITSHAFVGANVVIGDDCLIYQNVVIRESCTLGNRVILQPGVVVGACGFGYFTDSHGKHNKLKQLGNVVIEDDVEIGAHTVIDRARFKTTRIGKGSKLDNLIQIAHQVEVGEDNLMAAQVGIAGSTKTGSHVIMGGQVGVAGHLSIASGSIFAAKCGISKSVTQGGVYSGIPAMPIKECNKQVVLIRNIEEFVKRIQSLEHSLRELIQQKETETTSS